MTYRISFWSNIRDLRYKVGQIIMKKKWVLRHCDLDLWLKVTNLNRVLVSTISNHLAKIASKSVHPFGWKFVHKQSWTHTQTNCSENITPPRFHGGVKGKEKKNVNWSENNKIMNRFYTALYFFGPTLYTKQYWHISFN